MNRKNLTKIVMYTMSFYFFCAALIMSVTAAFAEDGTKRDEEPIETIVVTGLPGVTRSLTEAKRESIGVVDSLTSAQIDITPDFTLADVVSRIPGVFGVAFQGQPRFFSLRGLDARYNSASVDGNPIWNSSENNRGTQLDIIPASLINQVDVIKATTPDINGNSLGGHLAVRTLRAFDGGTQPYFKGRVQYGLFDRDGGANGDKFSGRFDAVGKFTFGEGNNQGIVLGVDIQQSASNEDFFNLRDGLQLFDDGSGDAIEIPARGTARLERLFITSKRSSFFAKYEMRASDKMYGFLGFNYFRVKDNVENDRRRFFVDTRPDRVLEAEKGFAVGARGTEAYQFVDSVRDIDTLLFSGGLDYRVADNSALKLRASWSGVKLEEDFDSSNQFEHAVNYKNPRSIDIRGDFPVFTIDEAVSDNPADYVNGKTTYKEEVDLDDDLYSLRGEFDHNTYVGAEGLGYRVGGSFLRLNRKYDAVISESFLDGVDYSLADNRPDLTSVDFLDPDIRIDRAAYHQFFAENATVYQDEELNLGSDYRLDESVFAGYGMAVYNGEGFQLVGGLRVEHTKLNVDNFIIEDGDISANSFSQSYTNFLPSFHAAVDLTASLKLRGAVTRTLARPDFEAFAFGAQIFNDGLSQTVISGNPDIEARRSTNLDASLEYYFDEGGSLLSIGVFYKDITKEHFEQTFIEANPADPLGEAMFRTTTFASNGSAKVTGIEFLAIKDGFGDVHAALEGLTLSMNYTYIDGKWDIRLDDGTQRHIDGLRNQPEQLFNVTASYETGRFGTSAAYNWRGRAFSGEFETRPTDGDFPQLNDRWIDPFGTLDVTLWYQLTDNIQINFAGRNITNSVQTESTGLDSNLGKRAVENGASYWFGAKVKY